MAVVHIAEATRAVEQLLGPYTCEEHAKRGLVVRKAHLNWAYLDPMIRLAERLGPDEGRRKHAHVPECDGTGPIAAMPLCAIGFDGADGPSRAREDVAEWHAKRVAQGTPKWVERARSSSASSGDERASPTEGAVPKAARRVVAGATETEEATCLFGIASLLLDESSNDSTSSHVCDGGFKDTCATPPAPQGAICRR